MSTTDTTYNGWTNYETWNLALWLGNDEGTSDYWREQAEEIYRSADANQTFSKRELATLELADLLKNETEDNAPEVTGFYADILSSAIANVNWYEIAAQWINDLAETCA